ncbi:hypothetical protein PV417_05370 [Streptomyces sp. ME19-03-3]|nr:hypothetical protein [Streptomyces sp. ME19-03-3]
MRIEFWSDIVCPYRGSTDRRQALGEDAAACGPDVCTAPRHPPP